MSSVFFTPSLMALLGTTMANFVKPYLLFSSNKVRR